MEASDHGVVDILPKDCSVGNVVYEYGITSLNVLPDGRLIFSNTDNTVRILDPNTSQTTILLQDNPVLRYGGFEPNKTSPIVLAIQEDHTNDTPYQVKNYIVAINTETGQVTRVVSGADFYYQPRFNSKGTRLVWLEWNHPEMLFDMSKLCAADWDTDKTAISGKTVISGGQDEGTCEPRWGPDDALYFSQEIGGHRQLFRIPPEGDVPEHIWLPGLNRFDIGEASLGEARYVWPTATPALR